jgi:hypothetical protein
MSADEELFETWAPDDSAWSDWAKPVAFIGAFEVAQATWCPPSDPVPRPAVPGADTAVVIDLPGDDGVRLSLEFRRAGVSSRAALQCAAGRAVRGRHGRSCAGAHRRGQPIEGAGQAHVAQLVEHVLGKDEVSSSILLVGSSAVRRVRGGCGRRRKFEYQLT